MEIRYTSWHAIDCARGTSALIDYEYSLLASAWILDSGSFDVRNLLELFNFLESVVLYDHLYICPNYQPLDGTVVNVTNIDPLTTRLISEGILKAVQFPKWHHADSDKPITERDRLMYERWEWRKSQHNRSRWSICNDINIAASTLHDAHLHLSLYNRDMVLGRMGFADNVSVTMSLLKAYRRLGKGLKDDVDKVAAFQPIRQIFIPPIPALILSSVSSVGDIVDELLCVRDRFRKLRSVFNEYNELIRDPDVSLHKSLGAQQTLCDITDELSKPYDQRTLSVLTEWKDVVDLFPSDFDFHADDASSATKFFLGKPLETIMQSLRKRKFLQLYSMKKRYYTFSGLHKLVESLWGVTLGDHDLNVIDSYLWSPTARELSRQSTFNIDPPPTPTSWPNKALIRRGG